MASGIVAAVVFPIAINIDNDPLQVHPRLLRSGQNDALVRLVRNEATHIATVILLRFSRPSLNSYILRTAVFVNRPAILVDVVQFWATVSAVEGCRLPPPGIMSAGPPEPSISCKIDHADFTLFGRLQQYRAGAIAEKTQVERSV